ncbi:uncharacterized protein [Oryctolagus cuniculus]|uniref:uncharacterized protein n=1 Tax=Oryctolagus cuniculus TaxID=9986 RepID=UPI00387919EC
MLLAEPDFRKSTPRASAPVPEEQKRSLPVQGSDASCLERPPHQRPWGVRRWTPQAARRCIRGATAAANGECACARRCAPEVAPCAPEVAPCGPLCSGRSPRRSSLLLPESPREPSGAVLDAAGGACGRPKSPGVRPGSERLRPEAAAAGTLPFWKCVGAVLFLGSFRKSTPRASAPVPEEQKRSLHPASWSSLLEHVLSTGAKPSNKEVSSQEQHLQEGPGCWCRRSGSRFNRTLRFVPPRLVSLLKMFVRIICRPWPQAGDTRAFRSQGKGRINCVLYCML